MSDRCNRCGGIYRGLALDCDCTTPPPALELDALNAAHRFARQLEAALEQVFEAQARNGGGTREPHVLEALDQRIESIATHPALPHGSGR